MLNDIVRASEIDFTCVNVPIPSNATLTPKKANIFARNGLCKPFSR